MQKREVVDELIGELRLDSCRDVRIGRYSLCKR